MPTTGDTDVGTGGSEIGTPSCFRVETKVLRLSVRETGWGKGKVWLAEMCFGREGKGKEGHIWAERA